jgi:proteic killer suppression protein
MLSTTFDHGCGARRPGLSSVGVQRSYERRARRCGGPRVPSGHFEKLDGQLEGLRSLRINKQWRVIVELRGEAPKKKIGVLRIDDYH